MTVNSSTARQQYNGNGVTTAFTVPFRFLDNTHLQVIRTSAAGVDTTLVLSTDYTVTGAGAATGTITMVTAPASGEKLTIVRSMPFSQQIDLVNGDPLPAETLEAGLDARAMEAQQLKDAVSRSLSLPISSSASAVLPEAIPLALLGWNATGDALQSFAGAAGVAVSSFMAPAVAAADATAAQTAIGGTSVGRSVFSAANAAAARTALTAAASGANSDITSLTGLTSPIPSANTVGKLESLPNPTLSANAMTLPASTHALDFRSPTLSDGLPSTVSGTAAALVIPAGATLGTVSAVQSTIVEVIINNAGTLEKAVVNLAGGNDLFETGVISTTAISAGATAANVFYSTTARTNVPYRVVRTITSIQATAGQWATNPSAIQVAGGKALDAMQSFGYGQTWQSVTRTSGTTYYNTTGKPITFSAYSIVATAIDYTITVNGLQVARSAYNSGTSGVQFVSAVIPPGASYVLTVAAGGAPTSVELR